MLPNGKVRKKLTKGIQYHWKNLQYICRAHTSLRVTQSETEHSTASSEEAGQLI